MCFHRFPGLPAVWGLILSFVLIALIGAACSSPKPSSSATAVKLVVDEDGPYQITAASLRQVGFDLAGEPRSEISLSTGGGFVPFEWVEQGSDLAIQFGGLRLAPDSYTPQNVYWLKRNQGASTPQAATGPQPTATAPSATGVLTSTVRLEEELRYDPQAADFSERWYWQTLFAPAKVEVPFDAPGVQDAPAELRIYVIAKSSAPVDPDHRLLIFLNGSLAADALWDGAVPLLLSASIPAGLLKPDGNQLVIEAPGDTGAPADSVQLHWAEIAYQRTPEATPAVREPVAIEVAASSTLPDWPGGADLVIVTAPQFRDALRPLVEARTKQGLRVAVIDVERVYDAFSHGRVDPRAIQSLMRHARESWQAPAPRYLLLAGDASYDVVGRKKGPEADIIPTRDVYTAFSGWTGSDVWYALPDDGETTMPAFSVGRFPAQTAKQMSSMVQKTLSYEAQGSDPGWRSEALLVADNDEPGFAEETQAFADQLTGYQARQVTIEGDGMNARTALITRFTEGVGLIGYFGHGSVTLWAKEKVFEVADAAKLENRDRLPVVFTVTCLSGYFEDPSTVSLGETLLRRADGGAVAALVPSSAAILSEQKLLAQGLAQALARPASRVLGDIVLEAQLALPRKTGGVRDILLTFNLLGDPSLTITR